MKNKRIIDAWNRITPGEDVEDRILDNILKHSKTKGSSKVTVFTRNKIFVPVAVCLLLLFLFSSFIQKEDNSKLGDIASVDQIITTSIPDDKTEPAFNGFVLTAYAAEAEDTYLSADYQKDTIATVLKPDVKVLLAAYSPLMSSVPGLPFTFSLNSSGDNSLQADSMKITVDNGELLSWDIGTGIVTSKGTSVSCKNGETLYWSPLSTTDSQRTNITSLDTQIIITAIMEGKEIGQQTIYITEVNGNYYAKVGELIQL